MALLLDCSIDSFWLIVFGVWFLVGPGGYREGPGSLQNPDGLPWGASRGPSEPPGPGPKNLKTHTCCMGRSMALLGDRSWRPRLALLVGLSWVAALTFCGHPQSRPWRAL